MNSTVDHIQTVRNSLKKEGIDPETYFPSCLGCGYCCFQATCTFGVELFGFIHPCPGLHWNGEKYRCKFAEDFGNELYIGTGCCSSTNIWRKEVKERFF